MAESGKSTEDSGAGWWGNLLSVAKEQTEKVYEMVSHDLTEFTSTMQTDTKHVVEKTKETLQTSADNPENLNTTDRVKQGFHNLMSGITKALTVDPEDTTPPKQPVSQPGTGIFDRAEARKRAIQIDTGTYLQEPSGPSEKYADWLRSFDLDTHKGEISDLLVTMVEVRSLYTSLVPSQVSHQDFWRRYFYKVHQLNLDEERKKALMKRAERVDIKEDSIDWDEEESSGDEDATPSKRSPGKREDPALREDPASRLQAAESEDVKTKTGKPSTAKPRKSMEGATEQRVESKISEDTDTADSAKLKEDEIDKTNEKLEKTDIGTSSGKKPTQEDKKTDEQAKKSKDHDTDKCDKTEAKDIGTKEKGSTVDEIEERDVEKEDSDKTAESEKTVESKETLKVDEETCDKESDKKEAGVNEKELKTKVKGDMVVVGDRISPSSDSSGTKESSNDDWEQDFEVDVTAEDLASASELAQKMNMTAAEYNKLTGGEDEDWENWD